MSNLTINTKRIIESMKDYPKSTLVCASKYLTSDMIEEIFIAGVSNFGENQVQALLKKKQELGDLNICWHFIGHLQTNKVKQVINDIDYLHALDRIKLADVIQKYRTKPLDCFIEVNLGEVNTKSGIKKEDLGNFVHLLTEYDKINVVGLMAMGINGNLDETIAIFKELVVLKESFSLKYVSMGMTDDYLVALELGSDFVRVGRKFIL